MARLAGEGRAPLIGVLLGAALLILAVTSARSEQESAVAPSTRSDATFTALGDPTADAPSSDTIARDRAGTTVPVVSFAIDPMLIPEPRRSHVADSGEAESSARTPRSKGQAALAPLSNSVLERPIAPPEE